MLARLAIALLSPKRGGCFFSERQKRPGEGPCAGLLEVLSPRKVIEDRGCALL